MSEFNPNTPVDEGEVSVYSYDGVSGSRVDTGLGGMEGSSLEGDRTGTVNVRWVNPGGVINKDVWLTGNPSYPGPSEGDTKEEINNAIFDTVTGKLSHGGDYTTWVQDFHETGCVYVDGQPY